MPESLQDLLATGANLIRAGQLGDAQDLGTVLLRRFRGHPLAHLFAADTADAQGDRTGAIAHLESLPPSQRGNPAVLLRKAQLLFADARREEARSAAMAAGERLERDPWQYRTLASVLSDCQDPKAAHVWLERGHGMFPRHPALLSDLAFAEFQLNRLDDAERHIAAVLQINPFHAGVLQLRSTLRTQTQDRNHVRDLESRLANGPRQTDFVVACCFALAKEYEDLGEYDKSFNALSRGASTYRATLKYDTRTELSAHEEIRAKFTREAFESIGAGFDAEGPIFIVGMPRTGTTLVERILTSHSQVSSVGELTDFPLLLADLVRQRHATVPPGEDDIDASFHIDFHDLGRRYIESAKQLTGGRRYFVDKLPYNFLYCGYILAALPKARIIHLSRDPLDTCYAVYKTLFFNAYSYSYDLAELADYYIGYNAHMKHWHHVLPGRILDVSYEALVQDPPTQTRRILDWCGLPWEPAVLTFHEQDRPSMTASAAQVREPFYTRSIGAWRRVEAGFQPVRQRLLQAGVV